MPSSGNPKASLEIALLDTALAGTPQPPASKPAKTMSEEVQTKPQVQIDPHPALARKRATEVADEPEEEATAHTSDTVLDSATWPLILAAIKQKHNTLYSIVHITRPTFEPGSVTLECSFAFHQKKLSEKASKKTLADIIHDVTGQDMRIDCIIGEGFENDEAPTTKPVLPPAEEVVHSVATPPKPRTEEVKTISNIFGGAELLDS